MAEHHQPSGVAIIGMACRLPGADTPQELWRNLCGSVESIRFFTDRELLAEGIPPELIRHPRYVKAAPVLNNPYGFDAAFFEYSPREAALMDPQQRLFLEVVWAAFEDAGYNPEGCTDSVGVFAGGGGVVTSYLLAHLSDPQLPGPTGGLEHISNDKDFLATRVSYELNLTGPSITVQTACSTSLVAVHLACQSLLNGECTMAVAGAATVRIPHHSGYLAEKGSIHSSDGHCRSFDAAGTGTIFGSGVVAVLLKPTEVAIADRDPIYAVIKGTAVNNDGGRKVSYTAPSVIGQARAVVEALAVADVSADALQFIECHATGTTVGDPLEIQALTRAFRTSTQRENFCAVGSIKANIGHPEQAAGLAGLIKTALALHHGIIPPNRVDTLNPGIPFASSPFYVSSELCPFPENGRRRAGVNSLGIGGTNAFAVLEQAPERHRRDEKPRSHHLLCLSARSVPALRARAGQFADILGASDHELGDVCYTANLSRSQLNHKFAVQVSSRDHARAALQALADGTDDALMRIRPTPGKVVFLFSGQGSQYVHMAMELYQSQPSFRRVLEECDALARPHLDRGILDLLRATDATKALDQTGYTQPVLFAVEYALAQMWQDWGIVPDAVMGHSLGELTAACVAGVFSLPDAILLVTRRAALMQALPTDGAMLAVLADTATVLQVLDKVGPQRVSIAACNGPRNTVVSGPLAEIEVVAASFAERAIVAKRLTVSHAFHSELMEPMLPELASVAARIETHAPRIPFISNLTAELLTTAPGPAYWCDHARRTVRFADSIQTLLSTDHRVFVEIGPGGTALAMGRQSLSALHAGGGNGDASKVLWLPSIDSRRGEWETALGSLRELYLAGFDINWNVVEQGQVVRRVPLPTYPFQHQHFVLGGSPVASAKTSTSVRRTARPAATDVEVVLDPVELAGLRDHRIYGVIVLPTAVIAEKAVRAVASILGEPTVLTDLRYPRAVVLPETGSVPIRLSLARDDQGFGFRLLVDHGAADGSWQEHASGRARADVTAETTAAFIVSEVKGRCPNTIAGSELYTVLRARGLVYGDRFRAVERVWYGAGEVLSRIAPNRSSANDGASGGSLSSDTSVLVDSCLHAYPLLVEGWPRKGAHEPGATFLPTALAVYRRLEVSVGGAWVHLRQRSGDDAGRVTLDLDAFDDAGRLFLAMTGLVVRRVPPVNLRREGEHLLRQGLCHLVWREQGNVRQQSHERQQRSEIQAEQTFEPAAWLVLADESGFAAAAVVALAARGQRCHVLHHGKHVSGRSALEPDDDRSAWVERLSQIAAAESLRFRGVIHAWALDTHGIDGLTFQQLIDDEQLALRSGLSVTQAIGEVEGFHAARVWFVTRNAVAAGVPTAPIEPVQAALWGLGRTIAVERPKLWGGLIDLPPYSESTTEENVAQMVSELWSSDGEDQVALRPGSRYVARLAPWQADQAAATTAPLDTRATYLISGGLGMLGMRTARWLVEQRGVRTVVLTGRKGADDQVKLAIAELEAFGATVCVMTADMAEESDVVRVLESVDRDLPPLRGVVHCAGVLADGIIEEQDWAQFSRGTAPKLRAGWLLHAHTQRHDLQMFVVHSSLLSWTGAVGQVNYTAGNAFLDGLVDYRHSQGQPALALNWGPWAETGMATAAGDRGEKIWKRLGVSWIPPELGMQVFELAHDLALRHLGLTVADWDRYGDALPMSRRLVSELASSTQVVEPAPSAGVIATSSSPSVAGVTARETLVTALAEAVMVELGFTEMIDVEQPLNELGLDSLMSVNLANRIEASLGITIPVVKLIRGPSVCELAEMVLSEESGAQFDHTPRASARVTASSEVVSDGGWLVFPRPRPHATTRLFCFPYAGGGTAIYRPWADRLDSSIELVAVEPPGHGSRIEEPPIRTFKDYLAGLMRDLDNYKDKPYGLFGHCLGGLNVFGVARELLSTDGANLMHLFVSASRAPHRLDMSGPFEEKLIKSLMPFERYNPALNIDEQHDEVFVESLRHFNIGATDEWLARDELRAVLLPAVRADFQMARRFCVGDNKPWPVPITCFAGLEDPYASRRDVMDWAEYTRASFQVHFLESAHFLIVDEREFLLARINEVLAHDHVLTGRDVHRQRGESLVNDENKRGAVTGADSAADRPTRGAVLRLTSL